jgi:hypothetical protein
MNFPAAQKYILERLKKELHQNLCYHCFEHTIDVHQASLRLIDLEKIDGYSAKIIETAVLFHDAGMMQTYQDHELASVEIARKNLPRFEYSPAEINEIESLILVTTIPQKANTLNEMIICDADLDAIGREDFFITSMQLHLEWKLYGILSLTLTEWLKFEISFLENHTYYTKSAKNLRNIGKSKNLQELKDLCHSNSSH